MSNSRSLQLLSKCLFVTAPVAVTQLNRNSNFSPTLPSSPPHHTSVRSKAPHPLEQLEQQLSLMLVRLPPNNNLLSSLASVAWKKLLLFFSFLPSGFPQTMSRALVEINRSGVHSSIIKEWHTGASGQDTLDSASGVEQEASTHSGRTYISFRFQISKSTTALTVESASQSKINVQVKHILTT